MVQRLHAQYSAGHLTFNRDTMAAFILTTALLVVPGALAGVLGVPPYAFLPSPLPYHFYSQQPAFTESRSFYSPPPESRFQGFYYRTAWLDGSADSHVLFVTGQQSRQLVHEAAHLTRTINTTAVSRAKVAAESSVVYPASTIPLLGGAIPLDAFIPPWARGFVAGSAEERTTTTETATTSDSSSNNVGEESSRSEVIVPAVESNSVVETSSEAILTEPSSSTVEDEVTSSSAAPEPTSRTVEDEVTSSSAAPEPTSSTVEDEVTSSSAAPEPTSSTVSEEPASSSTQGEPSSSSATVEEVAASTTEQTATEGSEETTAENTTGSDTTSSEE